MYYDIDQAVILGLAFISFIFAYMAFHLDRKEHGALQIFFAVMSYLFIWATVGAMQIFIEVEIQNMAYMDLGDALSITSPLMESVLTVVIWGGIFFIFYLIMYFLWNLVKRMNQKKKSKESDPFGGGEYIRG